MNNLAYVGNYPLNGAFYPSFGGKKVNRNQNSDISGAGLENNKNVKQGVAVGKKLILSQDKTPGGIEQVFNYSSPVPIYVKNIKTDPVPYYSPNVVAHMLPYYNGDSITLDHADIFLNPDEKTKSTLIADSAHEYTHVLQRANDKEYYGLKNLLYSTEDITTAARISQQALNEIVQGYSAQICNNPAAQKSFNGVRYQYSTSEIERFLSGEKPIDKLADEIINSNVDAAIRERRTNIDRQTLNKAVRSFVKQEALNEAEAYTVTLKTLKNCGTYDKDTYMNRNISQGLYCAIYNSLNK